MAKGNVPIVRHSDRKLTEILQFREQIHKIGHKTVYTGEIRVYYRLVIRVGRHSHKPAEADVGVTVRIEKQFQDFLLVEALLALLRPDMKFEQHAHRP